MKNIKRYKLHIPRDAKIIETTEDVNTAIIKVFKLKSQGKKAGYRKIEEIINGETKEIFVIYSREKKER